MAHSTPSFRSIDIPVIPGLEFVNKLEERLRCPVCKNVLNKPMQLECGHHVCEGCVDIVFGNQDSTVCPVNDDEFCENIKKSEIFPDNNVSREVGKLKVYCVNKKHGCQVVEPLRKIQAHIETCGFQLVKCTNAGCNEEVTREKYEEHKATCPYRTSHCQLCEAEIPEIQKADHENVCPEKEIRCPNECDVPPFKRKNLPEHEKVCPKKPCECPFAFFNCTFTGSMPDIELHLKNSVTKHLELVAVHVSSAANSTQQQVTNVPDDIKSMIVATEKGVKDLKLKIVSLTEKLIKLDRKVNELPRKEMLDHQAREIANLRQRVDQLTTQVAGLDGQGSTVTEYGTLNHMAETFKAKLDMHDRQLGTHDVRIAEMDLKHQILETASYNGVIVWKIKDFSRRKQDAVNGRTMSLYSQPFYTSKYGYKMCVRTYLNGDGMGRNTHLSLFFVVMGGEFDSLLPWPFQQKVTLYILDQGPQGRHLSDHFHPDPTSTSFRRPTSEMNVASGCPLFVSHNVLESQSNSYIKDDTLFIRCNVDTTGLSNY